jgi:phage-related baseplate assembly protein
VVRERALAAVSEWVEANRMLGMNLRRSALFSKLHQEGVHSVELASPAEGIVLGPTEVYTIDAITVTVAALRDL